MKWAEEMLHFAFVVSDYHGFLLHGSGETIPPGAVQEDDEVFRVFLGVESPGDLSGPDFLPFGVFLTIENHLHPHDGTIVAPLLGCDGFDVLDGFPRFPDQLLRDNPSI